MRVASPTRRGRSTSPWWRPGPSGWSRRCRCLALPTSWSCGASASPRGSRRARRPPGGAGGTWVRTRLTLPTNALLDDPHRANLLWAGTAQGGWRSPGRGATWQRAGPGFDGHAIPALAATSTSGAIAAGGDNRAVYVGAARRGSDWHWQRINPLLGPDHPIFSLAVAPAGGGGTVLAGTFGALYRGVRMGSGWTWRAVAHTGDAALASIIWAPWEMHRAYASVFGTWPPVLVSRDDGRTWHPDTRGLPSALPTGVARPRNRRAADYPDHDGGRSLAALGHGPVA